MTPAAMWGRQSPASREIAPRVSRKGVRQRRAPSLPAVKSTERQKNTKRKGIGMDGIERFRSSAGRMCECEAGADALLRRGHPIRPELRLEDCRSSPEGEFRPWLRLPLHRP